MASMLSYVFPPQWFRMFSGRSAFFIFAYFLMFYSVFRISKMTFRYIKILNYRYKFNITLSKIILSSIYAWNALLALIGVYLDSVWLFYLWKEQNCDIFYE